MFAVHEQVTANRVDARIIDHQTRRIITLEISCPRDLDVTMQKLVGSRYKNVFQSMQKAVLSDP